ncbi:MAG: hypothetical protein K0S37_393 [Microbacterium sp.]|nr:hypothetical protein [Microbacterium sp.]
MSDQTAGAAQYAGFHRTAPADIDVRGPADLTAGMDAEPDLPSRRAVRRAERRAARMRRRADREEWASRIPPIAFGGFPRL